MAYLLQVVLAVRLAAQMRELVAQAAQAVLLEVLALLVLLVLMATHQTVLLVHQVRLLVIIFVALVLSHLHNQEQFKGVRHDAVHSNRN